MIIQPLLTTGSHTFSIDTVGFAPKSVYEAVVIMKSDYYPFGMQMPGRQSNTGDYRFGYNGMEKDPEMKGEGNSYTTEFRQYDPRLGRWMSLDLLATLAPSWTPYRAFFDNPILHTDPSGLFETRKEAREYKKSHGIDGKISKQDDGTFGISDKKNGVFYQKANAFEQVFCSDNVDYEGVFSSALITPEDKSPKVVLMGGADFMNDGTMGGNDKIADAVGTYALQNKLNIEFGDIHVVNSPLLASGDYDKEVIQPIADIIEAKSKEGGPVILYGYSYGGHILMKVAEELNKRNVTIDVLITIDAAAGPASYFQNNDLPDNVKYNLNIYQDAPSSILSHGCENEGINKVVNVNLTGLKNSQNQAIVHSNIDEYTELFIAYHLYQYFDSGGKGELKGLSMKQILKQLKKMDALQHP